MRGGLTGLIGEMTVLLWVLGVIALDDRYFPRRPSLVIIAAGRRQFSR